MACGVVLVADDVLSSILLRPDLAERVEEVPLLLEAHRLTEAIFREINAHLSERGLLLREGTMVDGRSTAPAIIEAPSSAKNEAKARDAEMHQTKKGNAWHIGMKAHIGADADSGLVHSVHAAAANESDVAHVHELLHGQEQAVFAYAGYTGAPKRCEIVEAVASGGSAPTSTGTWRSDAA
jgi:IS5 family transposase